MGKLDKKVFGLRMQQAKSAFHGFDTMLHIEKPSCVIELGTGYGGLAVILALCCKDIGCTFHTFEKYSEQVLYTGLLEALDVDLRFEDVFNNGGIADLIDTSGQVIVLCDNGNKPREFNWYAKLIKPFDIIMVHDFYMSMEQFNIDKPNICCEVTLDDIDTSDLDRVYSGLFTPDTAWGCWRKLGKR